MSLINHGNFIYTKPNGLPKTLCRRIIKEFQNANSKKPGETVGGFRVDVKNTIDLPINSDMPQWDKRWKAIDKAIYEHISKAFKEYQLCFDDLQGLVVNDQGYQVQYYAKGAGKYEWHSDNLDANTLTRIVSMVVYLNDVKSGGETEFKSLKMKVKPEEGKILMFPPFWTHLHKANVPISNDKYIISTFFILFGEEYQKYGRG